MSQKCSFRIVYSSSEEMGFAASELNRHTPTSVGWSSIKFCEYPQELGVMLVEENDDVVEMKEYDLEPRRALRYLTQVQLLVHEFKIASRVEMYVGVGSDYQEADFERLGFMNLDGNERSNFHARELKTVYVDERQANFIRFIIHRPHNNNKNLFQQVGFLAINVVGEPRRIETTKSPRATQAAQSKQIEDKLSEYKMEYDLTHKGVSDNGLNEFVHNNMNSLTLSMDPVSQEKLHLLMQAKADAIEIEDFDRAKTIKGLEHELKLLGVKLRKLDTLKAEAVRAEDFDYAKQVKQEAAQLRGAMDKKIRALHIPGFADVVAMEGRDVSAHSSRIDPGDDESSWAPPKAKFSPQQEAPFSARRQTESYVTATVPHEDGDPAWGPRDRDLIMEEEEEIGPAMSRYDDENDAKEMDVYEAKDVDDGSSNSGPESPKERSFQSMTSYDMDKVGHGNQPGDVYPTTIDEVDEVSEHEGAHPLEGVPHVRELPSPGEMTEEQFSQASQTGLIGLLGEYRARCVFSKVFALRDAVLVKLRLMLQMGSHELPQLHEGVPVIANMIKIMMDDKIHQVVSRSVNVLEDVLRLSASSRLPGQSMSVLDPVLTRLVQKLEDGNARGREVAMRGVDAFITSPYFGPRVVTSHALRPLEGVQLKGHAWRPLVARLRLLRDIVANYGINNDETGATTESVMGFPKRYGCFSHSNGDVRDASRELTTVVESVVGVHALEPFLRDLRPRQLEEYRTAFEKAAAEDKFKGMARKINKPSVLTPRTSNKKVSVASGGQVQTSAVRSMERDGAEVEDGGQQCMFCAASDPEWNEDSLDMHYWKDCTFLTPCPACAQVVEIAGLADHLLDECEHRDMYINCEVTGLAIRSDDYAEFQKSENYRPAPDEHFYCPLCYQPCPDNDVAWRRHISMQCTSNPRI